MPASSTSTSRCEHAVTGATSGIRIGDDADRESCIELWVAASAARDGAAVAGVAERARAKFGSTALWLVAEGHDGIDGFALVTMPRSGMPTDPAEAAVLGMLATAPSAQGRGVGRSLLDAAQRGAAELGYAQLVLHVLVDNVAAVRLYEKAGWRPLGGLHEHSLLHRPFQSYTRALGADV
jgi:ribosomal protein S18 acetylase RimI-like enzyme